MDVISNSEPYRSILLEKELVKKKKKKNEMTPRKNSKAKRIEAAPVSVV